MFLWLGGNKSQFARLKIIELQIGNLRFFSQSCCYLAAAAKQQLGENQKTSSRLFWAKTRAKNFPWNLECSFSLHCDSLGQNFQNILQACTFILKNESNHSLSSLRLRQRLQRHWLKSLASFSLCAHDPSLAKYRKFDTFMSHHFS